MKLYPAIDIYRGKVVRLTQGKYHSCVVYSEDPPAQARTWEQEGAEWIHVVDLEGAMSGSIKAETSLAAICSSVKAKIQFGGGVRRIEDIQRILNLGVSRVVLGTKALDKSFLTEVLSQFKDKIAVGLDVRCDHVQVAGWLRAGNVTLHEALTVFNELGVSTLIYTDIEKDGVLLGPNWKTLSVVLAESHARIILSGGISQLSDVGKCRAIKEPNFEGVIIGKALYDKRFRLSEAINLPDEGGKQP